MKGSWVSCVLLGVRELEKFETDCLNHGHHQDFSQRLIFKYFQPLLLIVDMLLSFLKLLFF
jgi:hypothetical protein